MQVKKNNRRLKQLKSGYYFGPLVTMSGMSKEEIKQFLDNNNKRRWKLQKLLEELESKQSYRHISRTIRTIANATGGILAAVGTVLAPSTSGASLGLTIAGNALLILASTIHCISDEFAGLPADEAEVGIPILLPLARWIMRHFRPNSKKVSIKETLKCLAENHDAEFEILYGRPPEKGLLDGFDFENNEDEAGGLWNSIKNFFTNLGNKIKRPFRKNKKVAPVLGQVAKGCSFGSKLKNLSTGIRDLVQLMKNTGLSPHGATSQFQNFISFCFKKVVPPLVCIIAGGMLVWDGYKLVSNWDSNGPTADHIRRAIKKLDEENEMFLKMLPNDDILAMIPEEDDDPSLILDVENPTANPDFDDDIFQILQDDDIFPIMPEDDHFLGTIPDDDDDHFLGTIPDDDDDDHFLGTIPDDDDHFLGTIPDDDDDHFLGTIPDDDNDHFPGTILDDDFFGRLSDEEFLALFPVADVLPKNVGDHILEKIPYDDNLAWILDDVF